MSTLLDEILSGVFISGTMTRGSCSTHKQGCNCTSCKTTSAHKNWKQRRRARLQGAAKAAAGSGRFSAVQREYEGETGAARRAKPKPKPVKPKPAKPNPQVVLVAGHDYARKGVNFGHFCENRYKRLLAKNRNLRC